MKLKRVFWRRNKPEVSCREVGKVLQAYLDGELENETEKVAAHVEHCPRCGLEAETYTKIKRALGSPDTDLDGQTVARLREFGEGRNCLGLTTEKIRDDQRRLRFHEQLGGLPESIRIALNRGLGRETADIRDLHLTAHGHLLEARIVVDVDRCTGFGDS